ncbi:MAG: PqqD family peptide modification chaperone [Desulfobacterales bacterium]
MSIDRPTFSESWYRVSELTPRLLGTVTVQRQHFRGVRWYVLQDPANNQYFRLNDAAYHFVAMFDGRRTVSQVWNICTERFGDAAPTQGEVIQLLCQLHASNLLQGNLAPDAEALFKRHQKRVWREVKGAVGNFLFVRIPLWDPDRFLNRWVGVVGKAFSVYGAILWAGLLAVGLVSVGGHVPALAAKASGVLDPENLPLLYAALVVVKLIHELGHAFACKHFGRAAGTGGEVHQMGVTFLVFTPLPFVDASSAWALRDKWHRVVVGAGGMLAELAIAAIAAILWVRTADGTTVHAIAYNVMFIASISSLAFNGNPFLRYDAYYILLDVLEIPNLESRSKLYIRYLVKRYLWGMDKAFDPSHTSGEKGWLVFYAIASTVFRVIIFSAIALILMDMFFSIGLLLTAILVVRWVLLPLGNFIRYLATGSDLARHRERAVLTSALAACFLFVTFGLVKMPDRCRVEGVVEPREYSVIHMKTAGFVRRALDSGARTGPDGPELIDAASPELEAKRDGLLAEYRRLQVTRQSAQTKEAAAAQIMDEKIAALEEQIERTRQELDHLALKSPIPGIWVAPESDRFTAMHLDQGQRIGVVADLDNLCIRAIASQKVASRLIENAKPGVAIRVKGRPDIELAGRIDTIIPAGHDRLPSAALGYAAGGSTRIDLEDPTGRQAAEPFFEILVIPAIPETVTLRPGQTMALRIETSPKPLLIQGWRSLQQLFQRRFHV